MDDWERRRRNKRLLIWGAIILCAILLLWLTFFEYYRADIGGTEIGVVEDMPASQY